jgi:hypothetical protein
MQTRRFTQLPGMTLAVMLTLTVGQVLGVGPAAYAEDGRGIEGTWLMEATLVDCGTGDPLPIPGNPFPALHTYLRGGTMLDTGASPPPPPPSTAVTRCTAHGIWERTGVKTFREHFRIFSFDVDGVYVSRTDVTVARRLRQGEDPAADKLIGKGTARLFDANGVLTREGCNTDRGRRLQFAE